MKRFLLAALLTMVALPGSAEASPESCQPYPECCAFEPNPWRCLAGEIEVGNVDPIVCPVLASLAPGVGPVIITSEGDVYIGSTNQTDKWYDCPPYDA